MKNDDELYDILLEAEWPKPNALLKNNILATAIKEDNNYLYIDQANPLKDKRYISAFLIVLAFSFVLGSITADNIDTNVTTINYSQTSSYTYTGTGTIMAYNIFK